MEDYTTFEPLNFKNVQTNHKCSKELLHELLGMLSSKFWLYFELSLSLQGLWPQTQDNFCRFSIKCKIFGQNLGTLIFQIIHPCSVLINVQNFFELKFFSGKYLLDGP